MGGEKGGEGGGGDRGEERGEGRERGVGERGREWGERETKNKNLLKVANYNILLHVFSVNIVSVFHTFLKT